MHQIWNPLFDGASSLPAGRHCEFSLGQTSCFFLRVVCVSCQKVREIRMFKRSQEIWHPTVNCFSLVLHPFTSLFSWFPCSAQRNIQMSLRRHIVVKPVFIRAYVELVHAMYMHHLTHHPQHTSGSPLQLSLPDTRVHYCSLTSASSQTTAGFSPSVILFVICCHWMMWCEKREAVCHVCSRLAFLYVWGSFWLYNNWVLTPKLSNLCVCMYVCMCNVSYWGFMCGAVCPQGFSPQWPQRRLSERDREREKEGERVPLLSPYTHTLITILIFGNQTLSSL